MGVLGEKHAEKRIKGAEEAGRLFGRQEGRFKHLDGPSGREKVPQGWENGWGRMQKLYPRPG